MRASSCTRHTTGSSRPPLPMETSRRYSPLWRGLLTLSAAGPPPDRNGTRPISLSRPSAQVPARRWRMKITGARTFPIETPAPHRGGRVWLVVRLDTDNGIRGYGELFLAGMIFRPRVILDMINDVVDQVLIGHDPYNIESLFTKIYDSFFSHYPEFTKLSILSALEMACWDIVGKDVNRPVYRLMGGASRERLRAYTVIYPDPGSTAGHSQTPEQMVERALVYVNQGFGALKVDP